MCFFLSKPHTTDFQNKAPIYVGRNTKKHKKLSSCSLPTTGAAEADLVGFLGVRACPGAVVKTWKGHLKVESLFPPPKKPLLFGSNEGTSGTRVLAVLRGL